MTQTAAPDLPAVESALQAPSQPGEVAEAHGSLCGLLSVLGPGAWSAWIEDILAGETPEPPAAAVLQSLAASTWSSLNAAELLFVPLLPDDSVALGVRSDCLARWCQGYNRGLALAEAQDTVGDVLAGSVVGEVVQDLSGVAQLAFADDEDNDEGEAAYTELVEYLRVSVQLVFEELAPVRVRVAGRPVH